ncbi:MAG: hypothetical protein F6K08_00170 [Okeania sp. SIO1H6]|nr:hypothetical protein [Okeania sp. SIO1H6]
MIDYVLTTNEIHPSDCLMVGDRYFFPINYPTNISHKFNDKKSKKC